MKTELCELAYKYGTDKCPEIKHSYTPFYYEMFAPQREKIRKVLEIGVGCGGLVPPGQYYEVGASLKMWRDFFPNAQVFGMDILPQAVFEDVRIRTFQGDETKREDLERLIKLTGSDIDVFIDDGSHQEVNQVNLCLMVKPMMGKDVIYIIEDVTDDDKVVSGLNQYDCEVVSFPSQWSDDKLVIVRERL